MKDSIISFIYSTDSGMSEHIKPNNKYKELEEEAYGYYEKLEAMLNEEQKECFHKFVDTNMFAECEYHEISFIAGFRFGLKLCAECFCDNEI